MTVIGAEPAKIMRPSFWALMACLAVLPTSVLAADWKAVEKVETYAIGGTSGAELYASIGRGGLQAATGVRAIAHTSFKLTWTRKYVPDANGCTLVSARPKLIITYTLPKPSQRLSPSVAAGWDRFIAGVRKHEQVHGEDIKDMVRQIEATSIGLSVPADPKCQKIRTELTSRLAAISLAQRQKSREFDRVEMGADGAIQRLILDLVNGP